MGINSEVDLILLQLVEAPLPAKSVSVVVIVPLFYGYIVAVLCGVDYYC